MVPKQCWHKQYCISDQPKVCNLDFHSYLCFNKFVIVFPSPYDSAEHPDEEYGQGEDGEEADSVKDKSVCSQVGRHKNLSPWCSILFTNISSSWQMNKKPSVPSHPCLSSGSETWTLYSMRSWLILDEGDMTEDTGFDHNHSVTSSAKVSTPPQTTPTSALVFILSPSNALHFPSQFTQDAFSYLMRWYIIRGFLSIVTILLFLVIMPAFDTKACNKGIHWSVTNFNCLNCTFYFTHFYCLQCTWFSKGADRLFVRPQKLLCMITKLALQLTSFKPIHWSRQAMQYGVNLEKR